MSIAPEPSTSRGDITLQPGYFTSSLYVEPLREDLKTLTKLFSEQYEAAERPFELFKRLWTEHGWCWLHLRVYDGRGRQTFLRITERVFIERLASTEPLLDRLVALFALYTFHNSQPSSSAPPIYVAPNIAIPIDTYEEMVSLPATVTEPHLLRLRPYAVHVLTTLLDAHVLEILPHSSLRAQNPSILPREVFVVEGQETPTVLQPEGAVDEEGISPSKKKPKKKKGRPSKRDKARKAKDALASLEKYVDKNTVYLIDETDPMSNTEPESTHVVLGQAPHSSLHNYLARKNDLLAAVSHDGAGVAGSSDATQRQGALQRANEAVLERLRQIDAMAAEKGLEVGGEGGEKTGLKRVERAVDELRQCNGSSGILGLLEGAGLGTSR
ncbi:hypothetical protein K466DRAFT_642210 [Polyporus arcularius HHB13444]|uniref:Uncharacterized protein n=1 Tax=Polyporus arcularius HHB13444 TaxID=1314778 RepID=A0A5C3PX48_9APHY|nr:hypothetical protein K466DRAFT_642210 [Polyporus arcularius HHB13444]